MRKSKVILSVAVLVLALFFININAYALSPETELLLKLLEKKGLITRQEAAELQSEVEAAAPRAPDKETIKAEVKKEITEELKAAQADF